MQTSLDPSDSGRLDDAAITARLSVLSAWRREGNALARDFVFADFGAAFAFMVRVALLAERHEHHPDWRNAWNRVEIRLSTHDAGGITGRDFRLAADIDRVVA